MCSPNERFQTRNCTPKNCAPEGRCIVDSNCGSPCKANGQSCSTNLECCFDHCENGICKAPPCAQKGGYCASSSDCCSGYHCTDGNTCCATTECGWDFYPNTQCVANGGQRSNEYANAICRSGQWKVIKGGIGCNLFPCDSGSCVNNKCQ